LGAGAVVGGGFAVVVVGATVVVGQPSTGRFGMQLLAAWLDPPLNEADPATRKNAVAASRKLPATAAARRFR
jgi:hypothetical protein